jgi:uncharacterized protein (DUF736 family)
MIIGSFLYNAKTDIFSGSITTLTFHLSNVELRPVEKTVDKEPDYRVIAETNAGTAEFGAAWKKRSTRDDKEYLSVSIDAPALSAPLNAAMFPAPNGETAVLAWNRPKRKSSKK